MEDAELLRRFRAGDRTAFAALVDRHEAVLCRYVFRLMRDRELAEDVVQETFMALASLNGGGDPDCLRAWLIHVARNRARDALKKEQRMRARIQSAATPVAQRPPESDLDEGDDACAIARRISELPEAVAEVLCLKVIDGLSYREISAATGFNLAKISLLVHEGLTSLSIALPGGRESGKENRT
ncbi:MAG: RNA polymerase sigma factor [Planctomycetes bacterium]|nr:RNA polymerase sigma factor [Planctomycetota bacterium]